MIKRTWPTPYIKTAILLFLALPLFLFGQRVQQDPVELARDLLLEHRFEDAAAFLSNLPDEPDILALKGEIAFRGGLFREARTLYERALEADPETARAHYGLGKLALGKMQAAAAVELFRRAVQLDPSEPIYHLGASDAWAIEGDLDEQTRHLRAYLALDPTYDADRVAQVEAVLAIIASFGEDRMGVYQIDETTPPVALSKGLNLIFADVMVGEDGPFEFLVDTGASQTVFTTQLLDELDLEPIVDTLIHGIGGEGKVETSIYRINELTVGGIRIEDLPVGNLSNPMIGAIASGIFSTATFSDHVVSIDYPNAMIEFDTLDTTGAIDHVPSWFFNNLVLVPMRVNGMHDGLFLLDTGAVTTVLSHNMAETLGVTEDTPGAKINFGLAGIAGLEGSVLRVTEVVLSTPVFREFFSQVVSIDMDQISDALGTEVSGVIGYDFMEAYRVSIDFKNAEVVLAIQ